MSYGETKVYYDGSHYIAIPKTYQSWKRRKRFVKNQVLSDKENRATNKDNCEVATAKVDLKELFETLYRENLDKKRSERNEVIKKELKKHIENEEELKEFVNINLERKRRNLIERRKRFARKVYLQEWSYFCTFTYDDKKHTEKTFKTKLSNTLKHFSNRKGWKYAGVWERSPINHRLHFHSLVYIPNDDLKFVEIKDFSTKTHQMQTTYQNKYFLQRFGRNDFEAIDSNSLGKSIAYLMKYLSKTEERIVYSKNLPTYFISDIMDEDIVCPIGIEERKMLLFDDFTCWDEGVMVGKVSKETISQLRKTN